MKSIKLLIVVISFIASFSSFAQTDNQADLGPLITDRPDATESPTAVPIGFFQVETGAFYESFKDNNIELSDFTYNTMLIRYGLIKNLELRLGWDYTNSSVELNGNEIFSESTFSPLLLGVKVGIAEEKGFLPEVGLLLHLNLPFTVKDEFRPDNTGVNFRFSFAHTLNEKSSLSYNIGAAWGNDSPEATYLYTLAYGYSITDKIGAYVEVYGDFPENSSANHLWDAGLTYLVSNSVQLDATVGTSFTEGQDILLSAGISFRIPKK
ncbi:transporter [Winogradskyella immobilis]|uniref:Transporter n=1 Tax=Winogradskyella immobilis TaxID=2816852 RepID=A0ABS8EPS0_9FLAO|nr:transporter [Winogradskyella immobilis]MCC1485219.1 transporter [Winogradskyella immobilis]MCG0017311.1 transporter [Winogradskyella immobilis]